jgi:hypothetical protein
MSDRAGRASNECHSFERPPTWNEFRPTLTTSPQHCSIGLLNFAVFLHLLPGAGAEAVATNTHAAPTPP